MKILQKKSILKLVLLFAAMPVFYQCMHDEFELDKLDTDIELNASLLTPIAYGTLNFNDIISEFDSSGYINTDPEGLLYLAYEDSLFSYIADELLTVPDQDFIEFFLNTDFTIPPIWTTLTVERQDNFAFSFANNEKLDSITLDEGDLVFNIRSDFQHTGIIQMVFPNIQLMGVPLTHNINIDDPSGNFNVDQVVSIDNYTIILKDSVGTNEQFIPVDFHVEIYNEANNPINADDSIKITAGIQNLDFDAVFGYIGDYELITQVGEMDLGFFENALEGDFRFANPQINFNIRNSYGVPAAVSIEKFTGYKGENDSLELTFQPSVNPFQYAYPDLDDYYNNTLYKDTTISINGGNSTVSDFLAFFPNRMEYGLKAISNPPTASGDTLYNYVTDDSRIDVGFEFILPLWFTANNFAFSDTMDMDLSGMSDEMDIIERVTLMLEVNNGLPLDIDFQVYFLDELYNPVDTMFSDDTQPVIAAGITTLDDSYSPPSLRVTQPSSKVSYVEFVGDEIKNLENVRYGIVKAGLRTPVNPDNTQDPALFYTDYSINFNMSVGVKVSGEYNID